MQRTLHALSTRSTFNLKALRQQLWSCKTRTSSDCASRLVDHAYGAHGRPDFASVNSSSATGKTNPKIVKGEMFGLPDCEPLPGLVVFDLDYCLWPFWCEMHSVGDKVSLYPESRAVLDKLRKAGVRMALASRTPTPHVASAFLQQHGLNEFFCDIQLVPAADGFDQQSAQKDTCHFPNIRKAAGIEFSEMLFFDDEEKNVKQVARLGVTAVHVHSSAGMTLQALGDGLQLYADAHKSS